MSKNKRPPVPAPQKPVPASAPQKPIPPPAPQIDRLLRGTEQKSGDRDITHSKLPPIEKK